MGEVLSFINEQDCLFSRGKIFQEKIIQGIKAVSFCLPAPFHGNTEVPVYGLQQFKIGKRRVKYQSAFSGTVEPGQESAAQGGLAVADAARNHHEPLFFIDAVNKTIQRLLMLWTEIKIAGIGR
jgi:hypothetical protein